MEFFSSQEPAVYRCYGYGRLSKKDAEKARRENDESNSIKNQRDLIHEYIDRHPDLTLCMEGYDDNYTGTNFERPHFQEMIQAVEAGKVNCIIVKDLSRSGRASGCGAVHSKAISRSGDPVYRHHGRL